MRALTIMVMGGFLGAGCIGDEDAVDVSAVGSSVTVENRLAANRLAANRLAANRLAANRLAANRLAANRLAANHLGAGALLATPEGRDVLTFVVSCALPSGVTLVGEHGGVTYEFAGELGLAERWARHPLDHEGQGWVSACLFARVNADSLSVRISMRGPHPALAVTEDERAIWSVEEGAFYGNYFTDDEIDWVACRGADQATSESGGLVSRDCAEPDPAHPGRTLCGFRYAGDCGDFARRHACESFSERGTFYRECHAGATRDPSCGPAYRQVITTYVKP
jgi:hypothetical protein